MKEIQNDRRRFLRDAANTLGGMTVLSALPKQLKADAVEYTRSALKRTRPDQARIKFSVIGVNHPHIYALIEVVTNGGGQFVSFYAKEPDLAADFSKRYPAVKLTGSEKEILEDKDVQLIISAAIPDERASIGIAAMRHGKDFLVDKPAVISMKQLNEVKKVQKETGRLFTIFYGRLENPASKKAGELVLSGAIGRVIQTLALAPHRVNPKSRPAWFFDIKRYGGIINDIGSHQFEEFLFYTGSSKASIVAAQAGNLHHPQYPAFQDFGDVMLTSDRGTGYFRLDWFTPDGLKSWGDDRIIILGTDGYIEIRKNLDIAGKEGGPHLFLVDHKQTRHFDCSKGPLPFGELFVDDIIHRTQKSMPQEHCFLAAELALNAQKRAKNIRFSKEE